MTKEAKHCLKCGEEYPYDNFDQEDKRPRKSKDWAHKAARGILWDLSDRGGIKHGFSGVDEEIRIEIIDKMADIIREAEKSR